MKVADLKAELSKRGLATGGLKQDLVKRLLESFKNTEQTKSASGSEDEEVSKGKRLKTSQSGNETKRRKTDSGEAVDDVEVKFEKIVEGPSAVGMKKLSNEKSLSISNDNLEVSSNQQYYYSYTLDYACGNVKVKQGSWFFEVRIRNIRQTSIGWCTTNCDPERSAGDYWAFSLQDTMKSKNGQNPTKYGEFYSNGDVLGCGLDIKAKTLRYWKNGKDLGVAFNDITIPATEKLTPFIALGANGSCTFNFGKSPFVYPQDGYNPLQCNLTDNDLKSLYRFYLKYRAIQNNEITETDKDCIDSAGLLQLQKDLGSTDEEDPILLIFAWKLRAETLWSISRDEWMNGFSIYGCSNLDDIKKKLSEWRKDLKTKDGTFRVFYNYVFDYLKEDKTIILIDEAITAWNIVLKERNWKFYNKFIDFLKATQKKSISRDVWQQLWHFMQSYPTEIKEYDSGSCWPILFDEFVSWVLENKDK